MTLDHSNVHPLSAPRTVDVAAIEKELENLWRGAGNEDASVTRATAFNLIYAAQKNETGENPSSLLADLTLSHPSRTILVLLDDSLASSGQTAWVTAYCHRPVPDAQQICSEFITLESGGSDNIGIASTIRALLIGGLPTTLIWHHSLSIAHPLLTLLADSMDRIITCEVQEASPASELNRLFEFRQRLPKHVVAADLLWPQLSPWRKAVATLFDAEDVQSRDLVDIILKYKGLKISSGALLMAAWTTTCLGWKHSRITLKGKVPMLTFSPTGTLHFEGTNVPSRPGEDIGAIVCAEFRMASGRQFLIRREPEQLIIHHDQDKLQSIPYPDPLLRVFERELAVWSGHPRREETLRTAREWQKEILFSMSTSRETIFCEYPEDVVDAAAAMIHHAQTAAIAERDIFRVALSGGSTPARLYDALLAEWRDEMEWEKWEVFWSDERAVPPHSEHSNYQLALTRLLSKVPVGNIFRMPADDQDLNAAAEEYSAILEKQFASANPAFDLILLGMGSDGHTASLFPGSPALESGSLVAAVKTASEIPNRLTFTLRTINHARLVFFLVTGENKADKIKEILLDENYANPALRVDPKAGQVIWIIDEAAASKLE